MLPAMIGLVVNSALYASCPTVQMGKWMSGDMHNHSILEGGARTLEDVANHAFVKYKLDWLASSGHGGAYALNDDNDKWPEDTRFLGSPPEGKMWRWQSIKEYSYPTILKLRKQYPNKLIIQGYEWHVPGHEHACVGIAGSTEANGLAIARHEYLFDGEDTGTESGKLLGVANKIEKNDHSKALAGVKYLQSQFPTTSYVVINHPSRKLSYKIADLRDFNNAAPSVCIGFEGIPGHQRNPFRGGYDNGPYKDSSGMDITPKARTYGGADYMVAKVGGAWDAMLGEGRRFWVFANSDFHTPKPDEDFYPGEYAKTHTYVRDINGDGRYSLEELIAGFRSGKSFIAEGGLISALDYKLYGNGKFAVMGRSLNVNRGQSVVVSIRFKSPKRNNNGDCPLVDHIDVISGECTHFARPGTKEYSADSNKTTRVIATIGRSGLKRIGGWSAASFTLRNVTHNMYIRLRGTNLKPGTFKETDKLGNPLCDEYAGKNNAAKAYSDLWFYSNPIFINVR